MATTADFRNGLCIAFRNDIYLIVSFQHVKPGKGNAFVRTKLKSVVTGKIVENTFNAGAKITPIRVERHLCQFLYSDKTHFYFMHEKTFETIAIPKEKVSCGDLLKDGVSIHMLFRADTNALLTCEVPPSFLLKVVGTETGVKGNTATKATKPALLETGATVQVPLFINEGDIIKIDSATRTYQSRAKQEK